MSTVLVTGACGLVGRSVTTALRAGGWDVRGFDLTDGDDLRDEIAVRRATAGCDAVVHAGAIPHDTLGTPAEIMATNVLGTWHVLVAAEAGGVARVVPFSSAQVFGCADGEGDPMYLPIDDDHPQRAARPYGLSKRLTETMCDAWSRRTGIATVVLRPVLVLTDEKLATTDAADTGMGAYVHADDVAHAVVLALTRPVPRHSRLTLCGPGPFDTAAARRTLGWTPAHDSWPTT